MLVYLWILVIFSLSGVFWFVSAEGYALAAGATGDPRFFGWALALTLAAAQLFSFLLCYGFGQLVIRWSARLRAQLERIDVDRFQRSSALTLFLAGIFGVPPLLALAIVAGSLRYSRWSFAIIVFISRSIRFSILYYGGHAINKALDLPIPDQMPF